MFNRIKASSLLAFGTWPGGRLGVTPICRTLSFADGFFRGCWWYQLLSRHGLPPRSRTFCFACNLFGSQETDPGSLMRIMIFSMRFLLGFKSGCDKTTLPTLFPVDGGPLTPFQIRPPEGFSIIECLL